MCCLIVYCLLKQLRQLTTITDYSEGFSLDDRTFPTAKKSESFRGVSILIGLTSEQRDEVETLIKQYPDVLLSLPGRTYQVQYDIKLLTSEPIQTKGYFIPYKTLSVKETEIQEMLHFEVT